MANNKKVVPLSQKALDSLKYEIAAELGLPVGKAPYNTSMANAEFATELGSSAPDPASTEDYWGHIAARDAGAVGGHITRRLIERAEEVLFSITSV